MMEAAPDPMPINKKPAKAVFVLPDHGVEVVKSGWPAILERTSKMEPISTGQGTHCCDETFLIDGCKVSVIYDYVDQSEPICILRYKPVEKTKTTP